MQLKMDLAGKLLKPVVSLLLAIGDGIMDVIHSAMLSQSDAAIVVDMVGSIWTRILYGLMVVASSLNPARSFGFFDSKCCCSSYYRKIHSR